MQKRGDVKGGTLSVCSRWSQPAPPKGELFVIFRLAQIKLPLSGTTSPGGGKMAKPERGTAGERSEPERVLPAARLFPQETSAADAVFLHDPTRENAMPGGPQTARHCSIISNFSAEYAQSTTTTTAASGGNREELLGQRPARRKCRPRHDADAGCRNPIAERIPIVFLRTAPLPPDAPAGRTAMPRRTGSPP